MADAIFDLFAFLRGGLSSPPDGTMPYEPIQYPLNMPPAPGVISINWSVDWNIQTSLSPFTYNRQTFIGSGERWRATIQLPKMSRAAAGQWQGFLLSLRGGYFSFLFGDVLNPTPIGSALGSPLVNGSGQKGDVVVTDGWQSSTTGLLRAGDKISIEDRLYQVRRDVHSDSNGQAVIDIFPTLRTSPADNAIVTTTDAKGLFALASTQLPLGGVSISKIYESVSFDVVEDI